jgi:hypothetical protein
MDITWLAAPKKLLYLFPSYFKLRHWLECNQDIIVKLGGTIHLTASKIVFPNGNVIQLGYINEEQDFLRYYSLEYDTVSGVTNDFLKNRELSKRRF